MESNICIETPDSYKIEQPHLKKTEKNLRFTSTIPENYAQEKDTKGNGPMYQRKKEFFGIENTGILNKQTNQSSQSFDKTITISKFLNSNVETENIK